MTPAVIGSIVSACTFGGAMLGMRLRFMLPGDHLDSDARDTIKVGIGLIATMTALVLGLITASAKSSFDAMDTAVRQTAIDLLTLDRTLARYGPETRAIREQIKGTIGDRIDLIWPKRSSIPATSDPMASEGASTSEGVADAIRNLQPRNDGQAALRSRAEGLVEEVLKARWLVFAGAERPVPTPFLVILVSWLTVTFASFGLFAPRNVTVTTVLLMCALSVGSAVFLVLEMGQPFRGFITVSADPLRYAYLHLAQ
jgi:hypothetical protein